MSRENNMRLAASVLIAACLCGQISGCGRTEARGTEYQETEAGTAAEDKAQGEEVSSEEPSVTAAAETEPPETVPAPTEPPLTPEEQEWQKYLMPHAEEYVNVRKEPDTEAEVVGKLYMGSRAFIEDEGEEWTLIESGQVRGYVKNEFCYFGTDALEWAKQNCDTMADITGEGVRIRTEQDDDSEILELVTVGDRLLVDPYAPTDTGWIRVFTDDDRQGYVHSDFVEITYNTAKAISREEEEARIAAEKAAREEAERKAREEEERRQEEERRRREEEERKSREVQLLAALIQCEAGGEPYEGQVAVGAVVMNRVASGRFPNSIEGVISQSGQFTPYGSGLVARVLESGPRSSCVKAALEALHGRDNTGGALYFGLKTNLPPKITIGGHTFY